MSVTSFTWDQAQSSNTRQTVQAIGQEGHDTHALQKGDKARLAGSRIHRTSSQTERAAHQHTRQGAHLKVVKYPAGQSIIKLLHHIPWSISDTNLHPPSQMAFRVRC